MKLFKSALLLTAALIATENEQSIYAQVASPSRDGSTPATDSMNQPRPTPTTRPEMKRLLEDMKLRKERIPLPPMTESEKESNDPRTQGYEGRLGKLYLPTTNGARGYLNFSGSPKRNPAAPQPANRPVLEEDAALTLDYGFKTRLFWIASRVNNCQYCLGHQESKLLAVGMLEDEIASLDSNWSTFPVEEQAAFALARRLTLEPHLLSADDIAQCKKYYSDLQVLEMILSVAGNNAINRWKEGVGVPQSTTGGNFGAPNREAADQHAHSYLTETSAPYLTAISKTVYMPDLSTSTPAAKTVVGKRPSGSDVSKKLEEASKRTERLPLVSSEKAKELLGDLAPKGAAPHWMRLLMNFPIAGKRQVASLVTAETDLQLSPLLRAQIAWTIALQNGAWYSLGEAQKRLVELGQTNEQIAALVQLDDASKMLSAKDRALLIVAKNLAASPVVLTDAQVDDALKLSSAQDVVQAVHYTAMRSMFDRFTEAAALATDR